MEHLWACCKARWGVTYSGIWSRYVKLPNSGLRVGVGDENLRKRSYATCNRGNRHEAYEGPWDQKQPLLDGNGGERRGDTGQERFDWAGRRQVEEHLVLISYGSPIFKAVQQKWYKAL